MLRKEQETVIRMVYQKWESLADDDVAALAKAKEAAAEAYKSDARYLGIATAFRDAGVMAPEAAAWSVVNQGALGYARISFDTKSIYADLQKSLTAVAASVAPRPQWHRSTVPAELQLALGTAKSKWADLQTPLYNLVADLGPCKTEAEIEVAVRKFTTSIT